MVDFKKVPSVDKCFAVLELISQSDKRLGITEISRKLGYHRSTVFNLLYTLEELGVLEHDGDSKFSFGSKLYMLGKAAGNGSMLIRAVRPSLEEISFKTGLSVFLGIRAGLRAVIVDKVDSPFDIKVSSEIGMRIPLLAGAGGKVLMSQLPDAEIDKILSQEKLRKFTAFSCTNKNKYKDMLKRAREEGFAFDDEEYIEGIRALAVALFLGRDDLQAAIWVVGLKSQIKDEMVEPYKAIIQNAAKKVEDHFPGQ